MQRKDMLVAVGRVVWAGTFREVGIVRPLTALIRLAALSPFPENACCRHTLENPLHIEAGVVGPVTVVCEIRSLVVVDRHRFDRDGGVSVS